MRGKLRIYLGPAPGVGKTYAMLDEGWRRRERGTDVVIGLVVTHDRPQTIAQIRDLEIVPPRRTVYRGGVVGRGRRRRDHRSAAAGRARRRARAQQRARVGKREALAGHRGAARGRHRGHLDREHPTPRERQRRRQSHHRRDPARNRPRRGGAARGSDRARRHEPRGAPAPDGARQHLRAREGRRRARQLLPRSATSARCASSRLLWVADRVEDSLQSYMAQHGITSSWETRERVLVAVTGAPGGDDLIRRAARMARRTKGDLIGAHVVSGDGLTRPKSDLLERHQKLLEELGGSWHSVMGDDVPATLVAFATAQHATQIVLGTSRRSRWTELTQGSDHQPRRARGEGHRRARDRDRRRLGDRRLAGTRRRSLPRTAANEW